MRGILSITCFCSAAALRLPQFSHDAPMNPVTENLQTSWMPRDSLSPLVTFIIPTRGRESLNRTLASLQSQTHSGWKAIVVCDHLESCPKWDDTRIESFNLQNKLGQGADSAGLVRNQALEKVSSEYLAFVDDDDSLDPQYVSKLYDETTQKPDVLVFRMCYVDSGLTLPPQKDIKQQRFRNKSVGISFALRTSLVKQEAWKFIASPNEDFDMLDRMRTKNKKIVLSNSIMYYVHGSSHPEAKRCETKFDLSLNLNSDFSGNLQNLNYETSLLFGQQLPSRFSASNHAEQSTKYDPHYSSIAIGLAGTTLVLSLWLSRMLYPSAFYLMLITTAFFVSGMGLVFLNQQIISKYHFQYPFTVSGIGLFTTAAITRFSVDFMKIGSVRSSTLDAVGGAGWITKILPIAVCKGLTLGLGNFAFEYLSLGIIQMLKNVNPAIILVVMKAFGLPLPSQKAIFFTSILVVGTMIVVNNSMSGTITGCILFALSELCEATSVVLAQKLLHVENFTVLESLYILTPPACAFLYLIAALFEWPSLYRTGDYYAFYNHSAQFVGAAFLGIAVNLTSMLVLEATSSLTIKLLVTVRGILLVVFVGFVYHEAYTALEIIGYSISLIGFLGYTWAQSQQTVKETRS